MWKIVGILVSMVVSGIVTHVVVLLILMEIGTRLHGNYEYYGKFPAMAFLIWGLDAIGFLAPGVVFWYLHKRTTRTKSQMED